MILKMDRKRKVIEISSDESDSDVDHNQMKHEFQTLKRPRNDGHPIILHDQRVEHTSANKCMNNNLSPFPVVQSKLEEHWNQSYRGMRYFISDQHPTIVPDQNTEKADKTNNTQKTLSLDDTLSQKLYSKIFIDENFIEIVRNNNGNKQERDIQGIKYDRNNFTVSQDSNLQKVFKAYPEVESCPRISHVDLLPLIEILSQNRYRKIFIDDNFIRILRNRPGKQMMNGFRAKGYSRKNRSHTVSPESISRKSQNASVNPRHHSLFAGSFEKQVSKSHEEDQTNVFHERKTLNVNPHLTTIENQNINLMGRPSERKLILTPNETLSPKLYRKVFFTETFIGIVRKRQDESPGEDYHGLRYAGSSRKSQHARYSHKNQSRRKMLRGKRRGRKRYRKYQKHAFHDIDYARSESPSTVVQDPSHMESHELSSEDLLPLIKILSQNLYRKITIGRNFIAIHRNRQKDQQRPELSVQKYSWPFSIQKECQEYGRSFSIKEESQEYDRPFSVEEEYQEYGRAFIKEDKCQESVRSFNIEEECQEYGRSFDRKEESLEYARPFSIEEECPEYGRSFNIKEESQEYTRPFSIEEECQEYERSIGINKESQEYVWPFNIEEEFQEYDRAFHIKEEYLENTRPFSIEEECQEYGRSFHIKEKSQEYTRPFSVEEECQDYGRAFSIEEECQEYVRPFGINEESQEYTRIFNIEEECQEYGRAFDIKEEYQVYYRPFSMKEECQEYVRPFGIKEETQEYARPFYIF